MAFGVSVSAVVCAELAPIAAAGTIAGAAQRMWLGRLASITGLPLLCSCFEALRCAAAMGPHELRDDPCQRLNLAVATTSIMSVIIAPRPPLSVIVARAGSALLCLEVWSQSTGCAGDVLQEAVCYARGVLDSMAHSIRLMLASSHDGMLIGMNSRCYAFVSIATGMLAFALCAAPRTSSHIFWPMIAPTSATAVQRSASWLVLSAVCAYIVSDATVRGQFNARTTRLLKLGLLSSSIMHVIVQLTAILLRKAF
eukprot:CAMPEP_0119327956 /NCGR_PEP_ID=MMETSP1333-20130426/72047_1 /TAXON_ID=418940 /ORGANISM="Scyphosphaera apsteinii, Strain RCC1455" /LENGTH=253 /DNA_ID=CAMNT_0007336683 /DNA_START=194 /DNA_END=955 /DNA_ORIENTATION=-